MKQYLDKDALVAEIERLISNGQVKLQESQESNDDESYVAWSEHIATCIRILSFINTLEVIDPYATQVQYPSIKDGIEAHAETYSFNIESELFNQLTKEQQKLWREEIEQACVSGGEMGVELARDPRYKENFEVKEMDLGLDTINFSWKPITEIPTEHWECNDAISPLYLVRCGEKNGVSILGYSHYSFATKQWMDCYSTTDTDYDVMHKVTEWTDVKI